MFHPQKLICCFAVCFFTAGCGHYYVPNQVSYSGYSIGAVDSASAEVRTFLMPYTDSVSKMMNDTLGVLSKKLSKELPDGGSLGKFLADAYLAVARKRINNATAFSYMNYGGIRLNSIEAGPIRRGTVYEVMPFDNEMIVMEVKGTVVKDFLDAVAADGGGGVAGIQFDINQKKAVNILVGGKALEPDASYVMVNSDYVVNGGGGFNGFKTLPKTRTGFLLRNAIIEYIAGFTQVKSEVIVSEEKRIRVVN